MLHEILKKIILSIVFVLPVVVFTNISDEIYNDTLNNLNLSLKKELSSLAASIAKRTEYVNFFENLARSIKNAIYWKLDIKRIIKNYQKMLSSGNSENAFSVFLFDANGKRIINDWASKDFIKASELVFKLVTNENKTNPENIFSTTDKKLISNFIGDVKFIQYLSDRKNQILDFGEKGIPLLLGFYSTLDKYDRIYYFLIKVDYTKINLPYFLLRNISKVISLSNKIFPIEWAVIDIEKKAIISPPIKYSKNNFIRYINDFFSKLPETDLIYGKYFVKTLIIHNKYYIVLLVEQIRDIGDKYLKYIIDNKFSLALATFIISFTVIQISGIIFVSLKLRIIAFFVFATSISALILWHFVTLYKNTIIDSLTYDKFTALQKLLEKIDRNYAYYEDKVADSFIRVINKQNLSDTLRSLRKILNAKKCKEYFSIYVFDKDFQIVFMHEPIKQALNEVWGKHRLENLKLIAKSFVFSATNDEKLNILISNYNYDFEKKVAIGSGIEFTRFLGKIGEFRAAENKIKILPFISFNSNKTFNFIVFIFFEQNSLYKTYQKLVFNNILKTYKSEIIFSSVLKPEFPLDFAVFSTPTTENELLQLTTDAMFSNTFKSDIIRFKDNKYAVTAYPGKLLSDYILVLASTLTSINNTAKGVLKNFYFVVTLFFVFVTVITYLLYRILLVPISQIEESIKLLHSGYCKLIKIPHTSDLLEEIAKGISILMEEQRNIQMAKLIQEQLYPQKLSYRNIDIIGKNLISSEFVDELFDYYFIPEYNIILFLITRVKANVVSAALFLCFYKATFLAFVKLVQKFKSLYSPDNFHIKIVEYINKNFKYELQVLKEAQILIGQICTKSLTMHLYSKGNFGCALLYGRTNSNQVQQLLCEYNTPHYDKHVIFYDEFYEVCNENLSLSLSNNCAAFIFGYNSRLHRVDSKTLIEIMCKNEQ